ncbi:MAG: hypothetical protein IJM45_09295 [Clostridia bacterium]|nr:hypothetical protein [Clostridia bacterium]MBQ9880613.1 hypothetical protein [Clostridia bacterium]
MTSKELLSGLFANLADDLKKYGFEPVYPSGARQGEAPIITRSGTSALINFAGEKGKLRLLYSDNKVWLLGAAADAVSEDDTDYASLSSNLFILDEYTAKDVVSVSNEMRETVEESFGKKDYFQKQIEKSNPKAVSRSAARSGSAAYDANTLALKLIGVYGQLRDPFNANMQTYGEFLAEDFFANEAAPLVRETIRANDPKKMRRLFNVFTELFDNGSNEVQDIICVTILGSIRNDPQLISNMLPYLSDPMLEPVTAVNRILGRSKAQRSRLEHPPKYKPKKKKKAKRPGSSLLGG